LTEIAKIVSPPVKIGFDAQNRWIGAIIDTQMKIKD
jgi:hypothetical protein